MTALLTVALVATVGTVNKTYAQENLFGFLSIQQTTEARNECNSLLSSYLYFGRAEACPLVKQTDTTSIKASDTYKRPVVAFETEVRKYIPSTTPTPTKTPLSPTPVVLSAQATAPAVQTTPAAANVNADVVFELINQHRAQIGKPAFVKDENLCSLAKVRSMEIPAEISNGTLHSGLYNRNLPYWITENAKYGSDEAGTVQWWLNSPIHRAAIEGDHVYSCGACTGTYCSQLFSSNIPK